MKKILYAITCLVLLCAVTASLAVDFSVNAYSRGENFHVVIDAGHGGFDGGAVSRGGVCEKDINLAIAKQLEKELKTRGIGVTLTRTNEHSLANPFAKNKKRSDMEARRDIIQKVKPDLMVSIHLNSFPQSPAVRGLQTFHDKSGETSKTYATAIQDAFNQSSLNINRHPAVGDFFILDSTPYPSVLVECGFLSNPTEEKLLQTAEYQKLLAIMIAEAISYTSAKDHENQVD